MTARTPHPPMPARLMLARGRGWMRSVAVLGLSAFALTYAAPMAIAAERAAGEQSPLDALVLPQFSFPALKRPAAADAQS